VVDYSIKLSFKVIWWEEVVWLQVAQVNARWRAIFNTVINIRLP
jgi:hypothetical protein